MRQEKRQVMTKIAEKMLVSAVEKPTVAAAPIALIRMIFGATIVQCIKTFFKLINPTPKRIIKQNHLQNWYKYFLRIFSQLNFNF